jgi:hypothetical protein
MGIKVANNAFATLASSITSSGTSITLTTGQGARFPSLGAGDYFYATLIDTSNNLEIVKCTARSTDVLTVVRAQESTTARAYSAGDRIEIRLTAQTFLDATQALPTQTGNAGKYLKTDGTNASWESISSVTPTSVSDQANSSTGYFDLPAGTTAQRPGSPGSGMIRFNTTINEPEWYDAASSVWRKFSEAANYTIEYLVVAGGGGAGSSNGAAGGGAGGYLASTFTATPATSYTVNVGSGGTGSPNTSTSATNGSNSSITGVTTALGGGYGAYQTQSPDTGGSGGSGGGGAGAGGGGSLANNAGTGTAGQGKNGGRGWYQNTADGGGGGGGADTAGGDGSSNKGGNGGNGLQWSNGTTYAGGGAGGSYSGTVATGGTGGGGAGGTGTGGTSGSNTAGAANTGGGGGAGLAGKNGGSGIVILRYQSATQRGSGGTVTQSGGYFYHTFTSSGTFTA